MMFAVFSILTRFVVSPNARQGFRNVDLSNNPLGDKGIAELCLAIVKTETVRSLRLSRCGIHEAAMHGLQQALVHNASIVDLDVTYNEVDEETEIRTNVSDATPACGVWRQVCSLFANSSV